MTASSSPRDRETPLPMLASFSTFHGWLSVMEAVCSVVALS